MGLIKSLLSRFQSKPEIKAEPEPIMRFVRDPEAVSRTYEQPNTTIILVGKERRPQRVTETPAVIHLGCEKEKLPPTSIQLWIEKQKGGRKALSGEEFIAHMRGKYIPESGTKSGEAASGNRTGGPRPGIFKTRGGKGMNGEEFCNWLAKRKERAHAHTKEIMAKYGPTDCDDQRKPTISEFMRTMERYIQAERPDIIEQRERHRENAAKHRERERLAKKQSLNRGPVR